MEAIKAINEAVNRWAKKRGVTVLQWMTLDENRIEVITGDPDDPIWGSTKTYILKWKNS